ncbi:MAG TPA: hypothetical protein VFW73_04645 [Lacipirellulaceae bacterium]|nr:hypothetical protein [Lacipirellulaceae bacterium]
MSIFPTNDRFASDAATASALPGGVPSDRPLSATHLRELAHARDRAKSIRKAARVAAFNAWTTAGIAALSLPFVLYDPSSLILTVGLSVIAYNEFRGRKRLLKFDPASATLLGWNQLGLLAMIVVYCLWSLNSNLGGAGAVSTELKGYADLDSVLGSSGGLEGLYNSVTYALYGSVIGLSVLFQGGNAFYYFTRRRHIEDFVAETPEWVREVQGGTV